MLTFCRSPLNWRTKPTNKQQKHNTSSKNKSMFAPPWKGSRLLSLSLNNLVGGFNPSQKYSSNWVHLPQFSGWKSDNIWVATILGVHWSHQQFPNESSSCFWTKPPKVLQRLGSQIVKPGGRCDNWGSVSRPGPVKRFEGIGLVYPPPSNSHKWRFIGIPTKNGIILVVTVTGWGVVPRYRCLTPFYWPFFFGGGL